MTEKMNKEHSYIRDELDRSNLALDSMNDKFYKAEMEAKEKLDNLREKVCNIINIFSCLP